MKGKKIILGICGSIAAYKAAILVRLLVKSGAEVQVLMTESAKDFITPLTLSTLSGKPVLSTFTADNTSGTWNNHVELGLWADIMLIAPSSANTLAKMAHGIADDLLTVTYLSARCPVWFAPAMDRDMYRHPTTIRNLKILQQTGNTIIESEEGELASGLYGQGRMAEPEHIVSKLQQHFTANQPLKGKKVLITAGPTQEAIDPVRFFTNASSGKMGFSLATVLADAGAEIVLVSGPVSLSIDRAGILVVPVRSAKEMLATCEEHFSKVDIAIFTAAVADYAPKVQHNHKLKKEAHELTIVLEKNPDIAQTLSLKKKAHQFTVGFALETENEIENAKAKLHKKNFDMIVLNSLNDQGAGFGYDTNRVRLLFQNDETVRSFDLKDKLSVAQDIVEAIIEKIHV